MTASQYSWSSYSNGYLMPCSQIPEYSSTNRSWWLWEPCTIIQLSFPFLQSNTTIEYNYIASIFAFSSLQTTIGLFHNFHFLKSNSVVQEVSYFFFFITSVLEIIIAQVSSWHKLPCFDFITFSVISVPCQNDDSYIWKQNCQATSAYLATFLVHVFLSFSFYTDVPVFLAVWLPCFFPLSAWKI